MSDVNNTSTYHQGAIKQGTGFSDSTSASVVTSVLKVTLQAASAGAVDGTITLPNGSQIVDMYVDTTVAWTAAGAVTVSGGTASAGTQYLSGISAKTGGRGSNSNTAAQVAAMQDVGANTSLVFTATTASGENATGTTIVTVLIAQTK